MSKATEWVKRCLAARETGIASFRSPPEPDVSSFAFRAEVDYMSGNLSIENKKIPPEEALRLARWIIDAFG